MKLKPCPFCGDIPEKTKSFSGKWKIACWGVGNIVHNQIVVFSARAWNSRPLEDAARAEALKDTMKAIKGKQIARTLERKLSDFENGFNYGLETAAIATKGEDSG